LNIQQEGPWFNAVTVRAAIAYIVTLWPCHCGFWLWPDICIRVQEGLAKPQTCTTISAWIFVGRHLFKKMAVLLCSFINILINLWSSFGFLRCVVIQCFDISEEPTGSIFRVIGLVQVDAEVMWCKKMCYFCRNVWGNLASHSHGRGMKG
jgi:hypothetical protein